MVISCLKVTTTSVLRTLPFRKFLSPQLTGGKQVPEIIRVIHVQSVQIHVKLSDFAIKQESKKISMDLTPEIFLLNTR